MIRKGREVGFDLRRENRCIEISTMLEIGEGK